MEGRGPPDPVGDDLDRGRSGPEAAASQHVGEDGRGTFHLDLRWEGLLRLKVVSGVEAGRSAGQFLSCLTRVGDDHQRRDPSAQLRRRMELRSSRLSVSPRRSYGSLELIWSTRGVDGRRGWMLR